MYHNLAWKKISYLPCFQKIRKTFLAWVQMHSSFNGDVQSVYWNTGMVPETGLYIKFTAVFTQFLQLHCAFKNRTNQPERHIVQITVRMWSTAGKSCTSVWFYCLASSGDDELVLNILKDVLFILRVDKSYLYSNGQSYSTFTLVWLGRYCSYVIFQTTQ